MNATALRPAAVAAALVLLVSCGRGQVPETGAIFDAAGSGSASTIPHAQLSGPLPFVPSGPGVVPTVPGAVPTAPGAVPTAPSSGTTAGTSAFCRDLNDQLVALPNLLGQLGSADQRNTVLQQVRAANAKLVRDAPPDVRPSAQTLATFTNRIIDDVSATPPNIDDVSKAFSDPAYLTASAELGRYAGAHCGLVPAP